MTEIAAIAFAPAVPVWLLAGLGAGALLLTVYAGFRRAPGVGWRGLALAAALLALANPSLVEEQREMLDDVALLVLDGSPSQGIGERQARTEGALAALTERLDGQPNLEVRVVFAGGAPAGDGETPAAQPGDGTRLFGAIERALSDTPRSRFAGAVLVTDGQVHDVPARLDGDVLPGPVHVLLTGEKGERDRRLVVEGAPAYGIVGQMLELTVRVDEPGATGGGPAAARLTLKRYRGETETFAVAIGRSHAIPFEVTHGGPNVLEIEVEAGGQELTLQNNRAVVVVNGVRDRLRVLLVSGEPHAGERVWRNLLKADPSVDLVHFTILRPPEKQDGTPIQELSLIAFPIRELFEIKLEEFDLIIFDRYRRRGVLPRDYLSNISAYVEAGGALLEAAGPAFASPLSLYRTPLSTVLPGAPTGRVYAQGFRPALTPSGRRHPVTGDLPGAGAGPDAAADWGRWYRMIEAEAAGGQTLMSGVADKPVLILDRVGEGRVAQLLSDHAWLWARGYEGGGPQAELLRRLAHWLMKEPDLEEEDLRAAARSGRLEITRRSLASDASPVAVTAPSGERFEVTLEPGKAGRESGGLNVAETGLYHLDDGRRQAVAAVGPVNPKEFADPRTTAELLQPVAEASGGGVFWLAEQGVPELRRIKPERSARGRGWLGLRANGDYLVTGVSQIPMLPPLLVLALVLGGLLIAWRREGA